MDNLCVKMMNNYPNNFDVKSYDYPIQGKMIVASCRINELHPLTNDVKDAVRNDLIREIAIYMINNKLVEFTQIDDPISFSKTVKARCFLTPNDHVKIIRSVYKVE